ncbi:Pol protein [Phytophthora palmivora]|uniref:Pol protein n=1 Tax=Phytophthora palmivora TaxID=4796 RepID=A0A2P4XYD7_9STRA|nr:Pol protein [Phytophthora palmivora]
MASDQDRQKEYSDKHGRRNLGSSKLKHRFIGPFAALARHGAAYTIDLPKSIIGISNTGDSAPGLWSR